MEDKPNYIYAYELVEPTTLYSQRESLARIFFDFNIKLSDTKIKFNISPVSGWMSFYDYNKLWDETNTAPSLPTAKNAIQTVVDYLSKKNQHISILKGKLDSLKLENYLPVNLPLNKFKIVPVPAHNKKWFDHWVVYFVRELNSGMLDNPRTSDFKLPVLGSLFEFRIKGRNDNGLGNIIGFNFRFRPYKSFKARSFIEFSPGETNHLDDKDDTYQKPLLAYILDGERAPQNFLCPYFIDVAGHHGQLVPACEYSMIVNILSTSLDDRTILTGIVIGGKGPYKFHWSSWNPSTVFETGIQILKTDEIRNNRTNSNERFSTITVGQGVHNVILTVHDLTTKVVKQTQSMIFSQPKSKSLNVS